MKSKIEAFRAEWLVDLPLIRDAARLCDAVYDQQKLSRICRARGWTCRIIEPSDTALAAVVTTPNLEFVVLRGTVTSGRKLRQSIKDWRVNFAFYCGRCDRHAGFWSEVRAMRRGVLGAILSDDKPVVVAGHSQGGGEAAQMALEIQRNGRFVRNVITFGAPRSIGGELVEEYQRGLGQRTWRIVAGTDPVTWVLPFWFRHVGRLAYLDRRGSVWPKVRRWDWLRTIGQINHTMDASGGYLRLLKAPPLQPHATSGNKSA